MAEESRVRVRSARRDGLEALKKAIVGFVMEVDEVEGSFKLNQHKSDVDYAAVADALAAQSDAGARQIASLMREVRPQAFADPALEAQKR